MNTNIAATNITEFAKTRKTFRWRGQAMNELTREEIEDALLELDRMYMGALKELGLRRRVQLVAVERMDQSPSVIGAMAGAAIGMLFVIAMVVVVL